MPSIPQYLIESSFCLLVFYFYYRLVLQGRGGFAWNRAYLLLTPVLSLIIPGLSLDFLLENSAVAKGQTPTLDWAIAEQIKRNTVAYRLEVIDVLMVIYLLGVGFLGFRFLDKFWELLQEFKQKRRLEQFTNWTINQDFPKTSFFSYVFWNNLQLVENQEYKSDFNILKIEERNGSDVLFIELLTIFLWFNPLVFLYRKEMKEIHENNYLFHQAQVSGIFQKEIEQHQKAQTPYFHYHQNRQKNKWERAFLFSASISIFLTVLSLFSFNLIEETPLTKPLNTAYFHLQKTGKFAIYSKEKPAPIEHKIVWGKQEIKLEKIASPNGYSGEIELSLEEFRELFDHRIYVYEGAKEREFKRMDVHLEVLEEKGNLWFPNIENGNFELKHARFGDMDSRIMQGDIFTFTGMAEDIYLAGISIKIKNPLEIYRPETNVSPISKSAPSFGFQIVNLKNKKALLKIDTNNIVTRHILDLYADAVQYEVVHIPDFHTNQRFVDSNNRLFADENIQENYLSVARFDIHLLPEYQAFQNQIVQLKWGALIANPSSENYIKADIRKNFNQELRLEIGEETLEIQSFRLIAKQKEMEAIAYHSDDIKEVLLQHFLRTIPEETSIYFDEIVVKARGQFYYLPIDFVFNIGKNSDKFTITVQTSDENTPKMLIKRDGFIEFTHYPMSELIAILTGDERMEFENQENEPVLDVVFQSDYLSLRQGEELLLKRLYQQYYYSSQIRFETRTVWILEPVENTEKIDTLEYFYHVKPQLEAVIERNQQQALETLSPGFMDDLANLIERKFDLTVFNETELTKAYGLGLDLSSFDNLRMQLEQDYGIKMRQEERIIKLVKVVFPK